LAASLTEICTRLRISDGLSQVCLSGGTFQNKYLLERSVEALQRAGFEVLLHAQVPANDGGISLGQAMIANAILQRGV
jgi:hydrogenase maturation protein HypF